MKGNRGTKRKTFVRSTRDNLSNEGLIQNIRDYSVKPLPQANDTIEDLAQKALGMHPSPFYDGWSGYRMILAQPSRKQMNNPRGFVAGSVVRKEERGVVKTTFQPDTFNQPSGKSSFTTIASMLKNRTNFPEKYARAMDHLIGLDESQDEQILETIQRAIEMRKNKG